MFYNGNTRLATRGACARMALDGLDVAHKKNSADVPILKSVKMDDKNSVKLMEKYGFLIHLSSFLQVIVDQGNHCKVDRCKSPCKALKNGDVKS